MSVHWVRGYGVSVDDELIDPLQLAAYLAGFDAGVTAERSLRAGTDEHMRAWRAGEESHIGEDDP